MNKTTKTLAVLVAAGTLGTGQAHAFEAIASVVNSTPITESVNHPTRQCWTETEQVIRSAPPARSYGGAVLGGVAGGLLGSLFGHGAGRVAASALGAGVGAITGDAMANQDATEPSTTAVPVQHCRQVDNFQTVTTGYRVTYDYDGQRFSARVPNDPGSQLRVNVAVTPK